MPSSGCANLRVPTRAPRRNGKNSPTGGQGFPTGGCTDKISKCADRPFQDDKWGGGPPTLPPPLELRYWREVKSILSISNSKWKYYFR